LLASALGCEAQLRVQPLPPAPPPAPTAAPPAPAKPAPITILDRVEFDSAGSLLRDQDRPTLDRIAKLLKDNPHVKLVELHGHTDDGGELDPNLLLSQQRAEVVRSYLVSQGVDAARLRTRAFGKTVPIEPNDTPQGRARNRRVDFRIVEQ
jgi:outer membrane protein OmpA-like peptidoglycan-associated protein